LETIEIWVEEKNGNIKGTIKVVFQAPEMLHVTIIPWLDESNIDPNKDGYDVFLGLII
jgi:hypothetical protein